MEKQNSAPLEEEAPSESLGNEKKKKKAELKSNTNLQ